MWYGKHIDDDTLQVCARHCDCCCKKIKIKSVQEIIEELKSALERETLKQSLENHFYNVVRYNDED